MLDREEVREGGEYLLHGKSWFVLMIHKPGSGESVTLISERYSGQVYDRIRAGTVAKQKMQMRVFQRAASLPTQESQDDAEGAHSATAAQSAADESAALVCTDCGGDVVSTGYKSWTCLKCQLPRGVGTVAPRPTRGLE